MKKFLSLVMALVLALSLVTISAGATEYKDLTDKDSITYTEAVTVMNKLGIISGYTDGSFKPTAALTRGAAAKIIAFLNLGTTAANQLGVASAPYKDVKTTDTFAPYIAYCKATGIIDGYADGTFRAGASLSGFAFSKMLLTSLGYESSQEGFTGAGWETNVAKIAVKIGLYDGNDGFVGSSTVTREQACLYALNTLKATEVEYASAGTTITIGGSTISIGGSKATVVTATGAQYDNIDTATANGQEIVQFGEQHFSKLELLATATDNFGRTSNRWTYDGSVVGKYSNTTPVETYTASTKESVIKSDLEDYTLTGIVTVYYNGIADATTYAGGITAAQIHNLTGNGTVVEIYKTNSAITKIVVAQAYLGKVTAVSTTDKTITVGITYTNGGGTTSTKSITSKTGYGDYVKDDYVMVAPAYSAGVTANAWASILDSSAEDIYTITAATKVSGTISSAVTSSGSEAATIDGTTYSKAASYTQATFAPSVSDVAVIDAYVDAYGYLVDCNATAAAGNYLYLAGIFSGTDDYGSPVAKAQIVLPDATIKTVIVSAVGSYTTTSTIISNKGVDGLALSGLYSYTVSSDKYTLTAATSGYGHSVSPVAITSTSAKVGTYYFADSSKVVMVSGAALSSNMKAAAYTGKTVTAGTPSAMFVVSTKSLSGGATGTIDTIFIVGTTAVTSATDLVYSTGSTSNGSSFISGTQYNTYSVYVNGVKTTIPVTGSTTPAANSFYQYGVDSNGVYTLTAYNSGVITAPVIASVYGNYVTAAGDLAGGDYTAADATVVDTRSNPAITIDSLSALEDNDTAVQIQAVYDANDKTISMIYVLPASTAATVTSNATAPVTSIASLTINVDYNAGTAYKLDAVLADLTFAPGSSYVVKTAAAGTVIASDDYDTTNVVDDQVIVVTAQDGTTIATYTIAVADA